MSPKLLLSQGVLLHLDWIRKCWKKLRGGYKVANLGLHEGFGHLFSSELAKANINEGDIVLLGYEYGWPIDFETLDQRLIMSGIDSDLEIYTRIPVGRWKDFVGYLFKYAEIKNLYEGASGIYSREAFDSETGQMIIERNFNLEYNADIHGVVDISEVKISDEAKTYLIDFKQFVEQRGASIYFISPPVAMDGVACDYREFDRLKQREEEEIGIPYISNPVDYIFPCELMADTIYHCNSTGEKVRTELLIHDLRRASIIE